MAKSEESYERTEMGNSTESPTKAAFGAEELTKHAYLWMNIANFFETAGKPCLLSIFFVIVLMPVREARVFQEWYRSTFAGEVPSWATFTTVSFVMFLAFFSYFDRRAVKSLRHLKKCGRLFRRLEKEKLITTTQRVRAMEFAVVLFAIRQMEGSPKEFERCRELMVEPTIKKLLDSGIDVSTEEEAFDKVWREHIHD